MRVDTLMSREVVSCGPQHSLEHAARLMWEHDCGAIPVCDSNGSASLVGMITDRDICMCALFEGRPLHDLRVEQAMARNLQTCRPDDSLVDAERKMRDAMIRRLPVVAEDGALVGILSMADLAREAAWHKNAPRHEVSSSEICSTLAAICRPAVDQLAA